MPITKGNMAYKCSSNNYFTHIGICDIYIVINQYFNFYSIPINYETFNGHP